MPILYPENFCKHLYIKMLQKRFVLNTVTEDGEEIFGGDELPIARPLIVKEEVKYFREKIELIQQAIGEITNPIAQKLVTEMMEDKYCVNYASGVSEDASSIENVIGWVLYIWEKRGWVWHNSHDEYFLTEIGAKTMPDKMNITEIDE
jgi:hypothetical protein